MKVSVASYQLWQFVKAWVSYCKRRWIWVLKRLNTRGEYLVRFRCNICGRHTSFPVSQLSREAWSCVYCGSNVRWRSIIHALSTELFGTSLVISDFPDRQDLAGVGLSDWEGYAKRLEKKFAYTNTYYHKHPFLDITSIDDTQCGIYDFIIASDVFEHICQPISKAFENARRLLKPGGAMIFTVPYVEGETREHFPEVFRFSVKKKGEIWVLIGETSDGRTEEFKNITFHGGPGSTVETRLFGKRSLFKDCRNAGFGPLHIHDESIQEFGIFWNPYVAETAPYRPLIYGLDTPPWVLRNDCEK